MTMVHVQTGNMLDVVVEGKSLGLKQRASDYVIWLPNPEGLRDVLAAEIERMNPAPAGRPQGDIKLILDAIRDLPGKQLVVHPT